ncbi:MAG: T9SS type A sorting domain-containing protein [Bacteroidota bacterium]
MKTFTKIICLIAFVALSAGARAGAGTNSVLSLTNPVISGPLNSVCPGQVRQYTCSLVAGATTYTWVAPPNCSVSSGQGTAAVDVTFGPGFFQGYLRVTASNATEHSGQTVVTVYSAATTPLPIQGPVTGACGGNTYTYTVPPVTSATSYTWNAPAGALISTPASSGNPLTTSVTSVDITFPVGFNLGDVAVQANSGCNSSIKRVSHVRSILQAPNPIHGLQYGLCDIPNIPYSVTEVAGASGYTWTITPSTGTTIHNNGTNSISVDFDGTFRAAQMCVTADNICGHGHERCMLIYARPEKPNVPDGPIGACNNNSSVSIAYYAVDPVFNANYYSWTVPTGAVIVVGNGTTNITVDYLGASSGNVTCRAENSCGKSSVIAKAVTVNACRLSNGEESVMQLTAYPNPAKDNLTVSFSSATNEMYAINMYDMTGRLVINQNNMSSTGLNKQEINLQNISGGLYNLVVTRGETTERLRVVVE